MKYTAEMIAGFLGGKIEGDSNAEVFEFAKIEDGRPGALSFMANPKYESYVYTTRSSIVIVDNSFEPKEPCSATLIKVADAYGAFAKLLELYAANKPRRKGISPKADVSDKAILGGDCYVGAFAVIEAGAVLGDNVRIYPNVYIGEGVKIGDNSTVYAGVNIYEECVVGRNVIIHSGAVIGADGFGFAPQVNGKYNKIPQIGNVVIEDDVEIGANTCIDRATMGSTFIRRGAKLDNLIQIGHNAEIGEHTVAAAQLGVAGTSKVGGRCMIGGQVGIAGHLTVGNNVRLASKTGVTNNIPDNETYMGFPAIPAPRYQRSNAIFRRLPELSDRVYKLEKQMKELAETKNDE